MAATFDINKLVKVLNLLRNPNENERRSAIGRAATLLLGAPQSTDWGALFGGSDTTALKATIKTMIRDLDMANNRIAELEALSSDWGADIKQVAIGRSNLTARWVAELFADGRINLNNKEAAFVKDHAHWIGSPTLGQTKFLQAIIDNIHRRYRLRPPP